MARTILVGDVHGCHDELADLLDRVAFGGDDELVMVGDLIVRGPDPLGTLDLLREVGARSVRGNHEDRLLRWRANPNEKPFGAATVTAAKMLRAQDWAYLAALPLWLDLPEHSARVVHAGVIPGVAVEQTSPRVLMYVRCIDAAGAPAERRDGVLWGARWAGPEHVVFGHNATDGLQLHAWATGLDTGCVYGRELSALVLPSGEAPPKRSDRRDAIVSVQARRTYWAEP